MYNILHKLNDVPECHAICLDRGQTQLDLTKPNIVVICVLI